MATGVTGATGLGEAVGACVAEGEDVAGAAVSDGLALLVSASWLQAAKLSEMANTISIFLIMVFYSPMLFKGTLNQAPRLTFIGEWCWKAKHYARTKTFF